MARTYHVEKPQNKKRYDAIVRMYVDDRLTTFDIARKVGISPSGVAYVLRNRRIKTRIAADYEKPLPPWAIRNRKFAESIMSKVGTGPGTSVEQLAKRAKCTPETVRAHLRAMGFEARKGMGRAALNIKQVAAIKAGLVRGLSQSELARTFKVGTSTIGAIAMGQTWRDVPWPRKGSYVIAKGKHAGQDARDAGEGWSKERAAARRRLLRASAKRTTKRRKK